MAVPACARESAWRTVTPLDVPRLDAGAMSRVDRYVALVSLAGGLTLACAIVQLAEAQLEPFLGLLALLSLAAGILPFRLPGAAATCSVGEAFSFTALLLYGSAAGIVTAALDSLGILLRLRSSPIRAIFNAAAPALAMWLAGGVAFDATGIGLPVRSDASWHSWVAAAAAAAIYFVSETLLIATAVALTADRPLLTVWREQFAPLWSGPAAGAYFAGLAVLGTNTFGPMTVVVLLLIPAFVYLAVQASNQHAGDEVRHVEATARMYESTIAALAAAVDARDDVTRAHVTRVKRMGVALLRALGVDDPHSIRALEAGALLHDVGKIGIPDHVLNKPGQLTSAERAVMTTHVDIGVQILEAVDFPFPVLPIVRHHHEHWDGTGYPDGLAGTANPLTARVLSVVDCYDALTSDRPYRAALPAQCACEILLERRGSVYDPAVVDAFLRILPLVPERLR